MANLKKKVQLPVTISVAGNEYEVCPMFEGRDVVLFGQTRIVRIKRNGLDAGEEDGRHFVMNLAKIPKRFRTTEYGFVFAGWRYEDGSYACLTRLDAEFELVHIRIADNGDFRGWGLRCAHTR